MMDLDMIDTTGINMISLFDGMSGGHLASDAAELNVKTYLASEIKDFAIDHTKEKYANTISIGDVTKVHFADGKLYKNCEKVFVRDFVRKDGDKINVNELSQEEFDTYIKNEYTIADNGYIYKKLNAKDLFQEEVDSYVEQGYEILPDGTICTWNFDNAEVVFEDRIDMLIGGSPCQQFSFANASNGGKYGLEGKTSRIFYEYVRIRNEINPTYFFLENVAMKKDSEEMLNDFMGVKGIHVNSRNFAIQQRNRIYWTNIVDEDAFVLPVIDEELINFQNYKIMTTEAIEAYIFEKTRREFGKSNTKDKLIGIVSDINAFMSEDDVETITTRNQWAYEEYLAAYPNAPKRDFVNELHLQLCEVQVQKTPSRDKMYYVQCKNVTNEKKISCITRKQDRQNNSGNVDFGDYYRFLTRFELCKGQTVPYAFLCDLNLGQIEDVCGDGWTIAVIAYFFKYLPCEYKKDGVLVDSLYANGSIAVPNTTISMVEAIISNEEAAVSQEEEIVAPVRRRRRHNVVVEPLTLDEQIEATTLEVEQATRKLKDLYVQREELKKQELVQAVMNSGKTYDEILAFLSVR